MRQFLLGLSISLAYIAGCLTASSASDSAVPAAHAEGGPVVPGPARYRYLCEFVGKPSMKKFNDAINARGGEGWRLMPTDVGASQLVCFERPA
jgi:hypothetical protein